MSDLYKAAKDLIYELGVYFDAYPHMQKGYVVDAIAALREALAKPVVPASFTDEDMKASWLTGFKEAEFQFRGGTEKSGEFPAKTPLSVAPQAAPPKQPSVPPGYALVPEHQQIIEAWTWFDANGDYHLSRNEPADYTMAMQVTPLVAAAPKPKDKP